MSELLRKKERVEMPSVDQFVQIYRASRKGGSSAKVAVATGVGTRTVDRALKVQAEHEDGLDLTQVCSLAGWESPTLQSALSAFEILRTEQLVTCPR